VAATYFILKSGRTYEWRSKESGNLYVFGGPTPRRVVDPRDQIRFRKMTDMFVESDELGNMVDQKSQQVIPMAFTRKGMVPPKSYVKLSKTPATPKVPTPVAQPAPRTVVSSTKVDPTPVPESAFDAEEPSAVVEELVEDTGEVSPAATDIEVDKLPDTPSASSDSQGSAESSEDGAPKKRRRKSSKKKKSGRKGDQ
jgi:hypothetical protein